jgi:hypothetical protein
LRAALVVSLLLHMALASALLAPLARRRWSRRSTAR